jgi:hypothetical protein
VRLMETLRLIPVGLPESLPVLEKERDMSTLSKSCASENGRLGPIGKTHWRVLPGKPSDIFKKVSGERAAE